MAVAYYLSRYGVAIDLSAGLKPRGYEVIGNSRPLEPENHYRRASVGSPCGTAIRNLTRIFVCPARTSRGCPASGWRRLFGPGPSASLHAGC